MPDAEALPGVWASQHRPGPATGVPEVPGTRPWLPSRSALLLTGDRQRPHGQRGLAAAARNPRITPVLVPGAGHQVRRSIPQAFYRAVDTWLAEVLPVG